MVLRLLCDEMLAGLCRWLRAAGHDAALAVPGTADAVLIEQAAAEGRLLLTRDRGLAAGAALVMRAESIDDQAAELAGRVGVDWLAAPFTRCLRDNSLLEEASAARQAAAPPSALPLPGPFLTCHQCGRLYWPGSHVRRMEARLRKWQAAARRDGQSS